MIENNIITKLSLIHDKLKIISQVVILLWYKSFYSESIINCLLSIIYFLVVRIKIITKLYNDEHIGPNKTLTLTANTFFLSTRKRDVYHYVKTCRICHVFMGIATKAWLYMLLSISTQYWTDIRLPPTQRSIGSIFIIVDQF